MEQAMTPSAMRLADYAAKGLNAVKDGYVRVIDFEVAHPHWFLGFGCVVIFSLVAALVF